MNLCFALINQSTVATPYGAVTTPILQQLADAITAFANEDVAPVWGGNYGSRVSDGTDLQAGEAPCYFVDNLDAVPGAAAYHDRLPNGCPVIYIALSAYTDFFQGNAAVSEGLGHEVAEVIGDPGANFWSDRADGTEEALELCDRLQGTPYQKNGVQVPNFLYPSAFDPGAPGPYDKQGVLTNGTDLTPGGYVILRHDGASITSAQSSDGSRVIAAVFKRSVLVQGVPAVLGSKMLARKAHHSSRTYRRGARL